MLSSVSFVGLKDAYSDAILGAQCCHVYGLEEDPIRYEVKPGGDHKLFMTQDSGAIHGMLGVAVMLFLVSEASGRSLASPLGSLQGGVGTPDRVDKR